MWTVEHSREMAATAQAVWAAWSDVDRWGTWNADIERIELHGEFAPGNTITMTPRGQAAVSLTIVEAVENERFVDEARLGGTTIRTSHRIEQGHDGVRVSYQLQATGPEAEQLGPLISADFPETLDALAERLTA
jgi:hypothetical protein